MVPIASQLAGWTFLMTSSVAHPVVVALLRLIAAWSMSWPCSTSAGLYLALACNISFFLWPLLAQYFPNSFLAALFLCVKYLASGTMAGKLGVVLGSVPCS